MNKYRIVQKGKLFYPQQRVLFFWRYLPDKHFHNGLSYLYDANHGLGFFNLVDAKVFLNYLLDKNTDVIHEID